MRYCCTSETTRHWCGVQCLVRVAPDDDVELNVLGCRVDILGTNCDQCVKCCFTSTETIRLIRTGSPGHLSSVSVWLQLSMSVHSSPTAGPCRSNLSIQENCQSIASVECKT